MKFAIVFTSALVTIALAAPRPSEEPKVKKFGRHDPPHTGFPPTVGHAFTREALDLTNIFADSTQLDELNRRTGLPQTVPPREGEASDIPVEATQPAELHRFTRPPRALTPTGEEQDSTDVPVHVTGPAGLREKIRRHTRLPKVTVVPPQELPHRRTRLPRSTYLPLITTGEVTGPVMDPTQFAPVRGVVVSVEPQDHTSGAPDAFVETVSVAA